VSNRDPHRPGRLALAVGLVLGGALGAWPGPSGATDAVTLLAWLAIWAPAAGALAGALGLPLLPWGWSLPVLWLLPLWVPTSPAHGLSSLGWAVLAWTGLFALGSALGEVARRRGWNATAACGVALLAGSCYDHELGLPGLEKAPTPRTS